MKIPQLEKKTEIKSCHNVRWKDNYSWIHQSNILHVLKDGSKLLVEVRKYLEEENAYTQYHLKDTKKLQKGLFKEIKVELNWMMNLCLLKIIIMNIGLKQLPKATTQLN